MPFVKALAIRCLKLLVRLSYRVKKKALATQGLQDSGTNEPHVEQNYRRFFKIANLY